MSWTEPRPIHRDLVDKEFRNAISDIPRQSLVALAQLKVLAARHGASAMESVVDLVLDLSPSVDGKRADHLVEAMKSHLDKPDVPIGQEPAYEVGL